MKLSYVLVALILVALLVAVFAAGFFVGSTYAPLTANSAYGPGAMMRGLGGNGVLPGYRPGAGMMGGLGRGFGMMGGSGRGFMAGGFFPGFGLLGLGSHFLVPLAFLALIVLVVVLLVRRPQAVAVVPATTANPPAETK
jgi:hypothetical protein